MKRLLITFVMLLVILGSTLSYTSRSVEAVTKPPSVAPTADIVLPTPQTEYRVGADGYVFLIKHYTNTKPKINIIVYPHREALRVAARKQKLGENTLAFVMRDTQDNKKTCNIHIVDPFYSYEPEIVGHEFLHCVYGQWHIYNR